MKEYVFKIIEDDGDLKVEVPGVDINDQSNTLDLMAVLLQKFLIDMSRHAVEDEDGFIEYAVQSLVLCGKINPTEH